MAHPRAALLRGHAHSDHPPGLPDGCRSITFVSVAHVLRIGAYRFFFYAGDRQEPPHIHVERATHEAKFWLDPVGIEHSGGFGRSELNRVNLLVIEHRDMLVRAWNEFFDKTD